MSFALMDLPAIGQIHDQFLALSRVASERFGGALGGKLLLLSGFDPDGIALLIGASVAGAASLCVDADGGRLREGLRGGLCDFLVGNPDESLRILKNEIRRGRAISVCLEATPEKCLAEMAERGVQPDLVAPGDMSEAATIQIFAERGALILPRESELQMEAALVEWTMGAQAVRGLPRIAQIAADSLDEARADTAARHHWLERSPRYLGRTLGARQCVRMTSEESIHFLERVRAEVPTASVTHDGTTVVRIGGQGIFS